MEAQKMVGNLQCDVFCGVVEYYFEVAYGVEDTLSKEKRWLP